ncbi:MAG TPA: Gfo/Idh/MocA family oxidoreductase [Methylomirabilota bacterium]|nr:Gfo/Idh/MocA family oxidoreductase [Methylomirabilota bacterium]
MNPSLSRRRFVQQTALGATTLAALGQPGLLRAANSPNERVRIGVMGTNGRGMAHINSFLALPDTEIAFVCDVDQRAIEKAVAAVLRKQQREPKGVTDFRRILDDPEVDVLSIAAPNHWHAPATILACSAGKHVYVEKPGSHNPWEAQQMVAAARKHRRVVQMGNQRRSWPWVIEAIERLHAGELGRLFFARTWYNNSRPSIGRGQPAPVPDWLEYDLWQGPAPRRPYQDNLIHYNWHWLWHWGNGELGNNGIHALDVARWGLGVDTPLQVSCGGGRYHYGDDQETPDIYVTSYDFGGVGMSWESHSCSPRGFEGTGFGIHFYGEKGSLVIAGNDCRIYDLNNEQVAEIKGRWNDVDHFGNFLDCIRSGARPRSDIEDAQKSTLLCHLGNIAYRTRTTLTLDPDQGRIVGNGPAMALWKREYAPGWEPKA